MRLPQGSQTEVAMEDVSAGGMGCLLVEDQTLMAELLRSMLQTSPQIGVIRLAQSVEEACRLIDRLPPDLLILDLGLPDGDGQQVALHLLKRHPAPRIILLSAQLHDFQCDPSLLPHIHASVDKTSAYKELMQALNALNPGLNNSAEERRIKRRISTLSVRELEVFLLIGQGKSNRDIATVLNVSVSTVESHRKAIAQQIGRSGAELVQVAAVHLYRTQHEQTVAL
jgi:two-component system NarL family response regulator